MGKNRNLKTIRFLTVLTALWVVDFILMDILKKWKKSLLLKNQGLIHSISNLTFSGKLNMVYVICCPEPAEDILWKFEGFIYTVTT
jgi:hypothetical protein